MFYKKWRARSSLYAVAGRALVAQYMQTMMEFPPRQSPDSWSPEAMMEKLKKNAGGAESRSPREAKANLLLRLHEPMHGNFRA